VLLLTLVMLYVFRNICYIYAFRLRLHIHIPSSMLCNQKVFVNLFVLAWL